MGSIRFSDKMKRRVAFYFSVALFCVLMPIILSYALGYQIDYRHFKIYKTGIIYISSHPAGATIFIDGKKLDDLTPAQVEELKPGSYRIVVSREGFYPWEKELTVRPNMVTKADRIVLFPVKREMKKMGERGLADFAIADNGYIYYMKRSGLYRSAMDGSSMKRLSPYSAWPDRVIGKRFAQSGDRFLFFDERRVWVVDLGYSKLSTAGKEEANVREVFEGKDPITDVFWYPGEGYIIIVTDRDIEVAELRASGTRNVVPLYKFNSAPRGLYFDSSSSSIYFADTSPGSDPEGSRYLYRIDLKEKFFDQLMKMLLKIEPDSGYERP